MLRIKTPIFRIARIVKSDRINALRKKYDAFLEDDKKRKERNDYILGKLDNMRYTTTAVQIRHKPTVFSDVYPVYNHVGYRPEHFGPRDIHVLPQQIPRPTNNLQVDIPRKYVLDESPFLKELSKKYILIPKLRPAPTEEYTETLAPRSLPSMKQTYETPPKTTINNNDDWKSKYDILNKLEKDNSNDPVIKYDKDEIFPVKDTPTINNTGRKYSVSAYKPEESATKYEHEIPEKDVSLHKDVKVNELNLDKSKLSKTAEQAPTLNNSQVITNGAHAIKSETDPIGYALQDQALNYNTPELENFTNAKIIDEPTQKHSDEAPIAYNDNYNAETVTKDSVPEEQTNAFLQPQEYSQQEYPQQEEYPEQEYPKQDQYSEQEYPKQDQYPEQEYPKQEEYLQQEYPKQEEYPEQADYPQQEQYPQEYPKQDEYPVEYEQQIPVQNEPNENVYVDENEYNPLQAANPTEFVEDIQKAVPPVKETQEGVEYPVEMINVQDFTPHEDVKLQDGVNINLEYVANEPTAETVYENTEIEPVAQHTEDAPYNSGIEAFDAEQREMFYSEETNEYAYDQQVAGGVYNQEYAQGETYPQNQEVAYYEGAEALQEQAYPVEVNEHEETATRYDQSYEQQYVGEYDQQAYEQGQQLYEQPQVYDQADEQYQQYQYDQPDPETVENIEQVLDNEQGFVENANIEQKPANMEQQVEQSAEQKA